MPNTRSPSIVLVAASFCGAIAPLPTRAADSPAPAKLNVLFIAVDDLNCNIGCYGHAFAKTPNIDRLAQRGVRFDRAYCQVALCNPSRTSLLSGRRPDVTRVFDNSTPPRTTLGPVVFLPEYFRQQGYFTARVGKIAHGAFENAVQWSVSEEPRGGGGRAPTMKSAASLDTGPKAIPVVTWGVSDRGDAKLPDGRTARRIVELLREHRNGPFFIAAGFHKPHLPFVAPRKYFDLFPPQSVRLPNEPKDVRRDVPKLALQTTRPDGAHLTEEQNREAIAAYTACTAFTDAQIGVILQAVDELKLWDSTAIVFWGDHGFHLGDHGGLWAKLTVFEQAARVPLIVVAPGKQSGVVSSRLVELIDLYPTLAELCGLPAPSGLQGTSFVPLLSEPNRTWKKAAFTQVERENEKKPGVMGRSVRTERWRYTEWGGPDVVELYDHDKDPLELRNLAKDPQNEKTRNELHGVLAAGWQAVASDLNKASAARDSSGPARR